MRRSLEILACLSALCRLWRSTTSNSKFVSALFKLHTLSGEQWKSCLCLWMLLPLKIFYEKTNASIHLWLGPGSRPINIQNRTGSMCFIRFIVLPDNRTNDVVCTRVKKLNVIKTFLMRPNVQGPPASSQIKQYDLVNYQIWSQTCVSSSLLSIINFDLRQKVNVIVNPNFSLNKRVYRGVPWGPGDVPKVSNIFGIFLCILFQLPLHQNILNWQLELLLERPFSSFYPVGNYQFQIDGHWTFNKTLKNYQKSWLKFCWIFF